MNCENCSQAFASNAENHMALKISRDATLIIWTCMQCNHENKEYIKKEQQYGR